MRLSELQRRANDPDDAQFGIVNAARIALHRRNAGLCEECGVLPVARARTMCDPCVSYITGCDGADEQVAVFVRQFIGGGHPPMINVAEIMEMVG